MPTKKKHNSSSTRPTVLIQGLCLVALVALTVVDAMYEDFEVSFVVYAIIAGVLFGIGNIKDIIR